MTNTDAKKEFDDWWRSHLLNAWLHYPRATADNMPELWGSANENMAWIAWQASRSKPIVLPMRQEPRYEYDTGTFMELYEHGNYLDVDEVKQAIEAAWYRCE